MLSRNVIGNIIYRMYEWLQLLLLLLITFSRFSYAVIEYQNWAFHFPKDANMGLFIALAIPIENPNEDVFVAYNFEANYLLPGNETETVQYPPLVPEEEEETRNTKKIDRAKIYKVIETKIQSYQYPGKDCLLRIICEVATSYFAHEGVLGDLIHILFTPSTSANKGLSEEYSNAEEHGRNKNTCKKYEKKCKKSFTDLISWIGHI